MATENPEKAPEQSPKSSGMKEYVRAESMIQLALAIPAGCLIGYFGGALLDRWLHQNWIYILGIAIGATGGFLQIYRVASKYMKDAK